MTKTTRRQRLLDWIQNGDPQKVPILFAPGFEILASCLGKDQADVNWAEAVQVAEVTGTHNVANVYTTPCLSTQSHFSPTSPCVKRGAISPMVRVNSHGPSQLPKER